MTKFGGLTFLEWARNSLLGHIVMFQIFGVVPVSILFLSLQYLDGSLRLGWALYTIMVVSLGFLVSAIGVWFGITQRLMKKYKKTL